MEKSVVRSVKLNNCHIKFICEGNNNSLTRYAILFSALRRITRKWFSVITYLNYPYSSNYSIIITPADNIKEIQQRSPFHFELPISLEFDESELFKLFISSTISNVINNNKYVYINEVCSAFPSWCKLSIYPESYTYAIEKEIINQRCENRKNIGYFLNSFLYKNKPEILLKIILSQQVHDNTDIEIYLKSLAEIEDHFFQIKLATRSVITNTDNSEYEWTELCAKKGRYLDIF